MKNNLKKLRKEKGVTQKQMASDLGVAESTVQNWEGDRTRMTGYSLFMVSDYLGVSIDAIYTTDAQQSEHAIVDLPDASEVGLLESYRACSKKGREMIAEYAAMVAEHHPEKPAE